MDLIDISLSLLGLSEVVLLVEYARSLSDIDIPNSITPHWLTFWEELLKTWSVRATVLLVTVIGIEMSCSREKKKFR